jgi:hypothetical protein
VVYYIIRGIRELEQPLQEHSGLLITYEKQPLRLHTTTSKDGLLSLQILVQLSGLFGRSFLKILSYNTSIRSLVTLMVFSLFLKTSSSLLKTITATRLLPKLANSSRRVLTLLSCILQSLTSNWRSYEE